MKRTLKALNYLLIAGAITFASCGENTNGNNDNTDTTAMDNDMAANADKDFVKDATELNMKELAWLKAGMNMGTDQELKQHAEHMLADHEKTGAEMKDLAGRKGLEVPNVDTTGEVNIDDKDKGKDWDRKWADKMVDDHEKTINRFERAENDVQDADLKAMISKTLPTLRSHLDMAKKLKERLDQ